MPTWASTESPGPSDQRVLGGLGGVPARGWAASAPGSAGRRRRQPPEGERDDADRGAAERGRRPATRKTHPRARAASDPGDGVHVDAAAGPTWSGPAPPSSGQPQPGEHDDDGRQGGQDVDDDLGSSRAAVCPTAVRLAAQRRPRRVRRRARLRPRARAASRSSSASTSDIR